MAKVDQIPQAGSSLKSKFNQRILGVALGGMVMAGAGDIDRVESGETNQAKANRDRVATVFDPTKAEKTPLVDLDEDVVE